MSERNLKPGPVLIDPRPAFTQDYYRLLSNSGNPFHRRGTEISRGYDSNKLRKDSQTFLHSKILSPTSSRAILELTT